MPVSELRLAPTMVSRKLLVLAFVREYIKRWGDSPSLGEIAAAINCNKSRVREAVKGLTAAGLLKRVPGPRGLALPDDEAEALRILTKLGWLVMRDDQKIIVTESALSLPPDLDYPGVAQS